MNPQSPRCTLVVTQKICLELLARIFSVSQAAKRNSVKELEKIVAQQEAEKTEDEKESVPSMPASTNEDLSETLKGRQIRWKLLAAVVEEITKAVNQVNQDLHFIRSTAPL